MGNIKEVLKILLVIQLVTSSLAYYGHPDAETIDFGSPTQPSRDQAIIEAAIKRGMDGEAVAELLRTKLPVVRTVTKPSGITQTTTYKLEDDGSISRKTVTQKRNRFVYNSDNVPDSIPIDDLQKSPTGTVTRTFTDADGNKVTQTIKIDKPKQPTVLGTDDLSENLFGESFPSHSYPSSYEPSFPSEWLPHANKPTTYEHRTITRTYTGPTGEKRVVQTISNNPIPTLEQPKRSKFPNIGDISWPSFDEDSFAKSWASPNMDDPDDWVVVDDNPNTERTTKKSFPYWTPRTDDWPEITTTTATTTTKKTHGFKEIDANTVKSLPSLEDFLKSQYAPTTTTTRKTQTFSSTSRRTPVSSTPATTSTTKKPQFINIEDLPVVEVLHNGKPANDSILKSLPPHLKPTQQTEPVLKIANKHPIEEDLEVFTPKVETSVRTYSKTLTGPEKPVLKDLDPQMQEVLRKAGINPEDITHIEGDTITKTRQEPDGRIITTTYKVNTVPIEHTIPAPHYILPQIPIHSFDSYRPFTALHQPLEPLTPFESNLSPISQFLAKLGLTKFDITSKSGRYSKTIIDDNGDVLTATFVLSSPKDIRHSEPPKPKPYK